MSKTLITLVKKEAKALKNNSTSIEKEKLDIQTFSPDSSYRCIYGQMTGDCSTPRAVALIELCCERVYSLGIYDQLKNAKLNGSPIGKERIINYDLKYISPIEKFIAYKRNNENGNNERLIKYLKGETKTLKLI